MLLRVYLDKVRGSDGPDSPETEYYEAFCFLNWIGQSQQGLPKFSVSEKTGLSEILPGQGYFFLQQYLKDYNCYDKNTLIP